MVTGQAPVTLRVEEYPREAHIQTKPKVVHAHAYTAPLLPPPPSLTGYTTYRIYLIN